jgi:aminopeptidase 2
MRAFVPRSCQAGLITFRPRLSGFQLHPTRQRRLSYAKSTFICFPQGLRSPSKRPKLAESERTNVALQSSQNRHCSYRNMCRSMADISGGIDITKNREVLPTNVVPRHYDLTLEPDFEKFKFDGTGELRASDVSFAASVNLTIHQSLSTLMSPRIRLPSR